MSSEYIRLCPTCGSENTPEIMRCGCGAMLAGIDLTARHALEVSSPASPQEIPPNPADSTPAATTAEDGQICPHADCAQPNPPGSSRCVYCDRPLDRPSDGLTGEQTGIPSLISLPGNLRDRFRILRALPATGAEAELLIVQALTNNNAPELVAKIYRNGIHPDREILERIATIDQAHRVNLIESGLAGGFTFELMEFCRAGSLRELLRSGKPDAGQLRRIMIELSTAIGAVHQAGLIHRDLKPENILIRTADPLDLVLTDFSIASVQNATLRFTSTARTLAYGAPETLSGVINQKADWWSLGMILLEAASGTHPFAGLSDAVILHRLTTRSIDLSSVNDPKLQKLLRGLLLRDPKNRWGKAEIDRWLADDLTLPDCFAEESSGQVGRPYQIGTEACFNAEQLAAGLAKNWDKAVSDLDNGLLMNWLRSELHDQNRVRLLIDLNLERDLHVDIRLLRLLIDLAPGLPPVWRGESLTLRSLLQRADRALKNDVEAAQWLHILFDFKVLAYYAAAGNGEMGEIRRRWQEALDQFNEAWTTVNERIRAANKPAASDVTLYDDVVYGWGGPTRPSPQQMHARLLAVSYDPAWAQRLRAHLEREVSRLQILAPWLKEVGSIKELSPAGLLALESLLPEARKQVKKMEDSAAQAEAADAALTEQLRSQSALAIADIQQDGWRNFFNEAVCRRLQEKIEHFFTLTAQIRALGRSDPAYIELRKKVTRLEPSLNRLRNLLEDMLERNAINRGWLSESVLVVFASLLMLLGLFGSQKMLYLTLFGGLIFLAWRLLPNYFTQRQIKELLGKISN